MLIESLNSLDLESDQFEWPTFAPHTPPPPPPHILITFNLLSVIRYTVVVDFNTWYAADITNMIPEAVTSPTDRVTDDDGAEKIAGELC